MSDWPQIGLRGSHFDGKVGIIYTHSPIMYEKYNPKYGGLTVASLFHKMTFSCVQYPSTKKWFIQFQFSQNFSLMWHILCWWSVYKFLATRNAIYYGHCHYIFPLGPYGPQLLICSPYGPHLPIVVKYTLLIHK